MLENFYMRNIEKFIENENYTVWKFPAHENAYEKQARPLLYSYSIMTRAYGACFNDDNSIEYFNAEGFDVYLVDWGTSALFSLQGWTLEDMTDVLEEDIIEPLLEIYQVDSLNVFGVCIGGTILSYLISRKKEDICRKLHRVAYYGVPMIGARDMGAEKTFRLFYDFWSPWTDHLKHVGISLFFLDGLLLYSSSPSMFQWKWMQFLRENQNGSFLNIVLWTLDDRWVPFQALLTILKNSFHPAAKYQHDYHQGIASNIHFLNIAGKDDMLVNPSASIIEWNSPTPSLYRSFRQMILDTGHFMFARPRYVDAKKEIALWFSGYTLASLLHKLKKRKDPKFTARLKEVAEKSVIRGYENANSVEKKRILETLNHALGNQPEIKDIRTVCGQLIETIKNGTDPNFFDIISRQICPFVEKFGYDHRAYEQQRGSF